MLPATVAEPEASRLSLLDVLLRQDGLPSPGPTRFCRCRCFPSPSASVPMLSRRASALEQAHELQPCSPSSLPSESRRPVPPRPLHRRERAPAPPLPRGQELAKLPSPAASQGPASSRLPVPLFPRSEQFPRN